MKEDLKKIGLTDNEIAIYLALLKLEETPVGGITKELKIHRQIAYNALNGLEKKNLIIKSFKNNVLHFKINDPKIIIENAQKQEIIAKRLSLNILTEVKKSKHGHEINIFEGKDKIRSYYLSKLNNTQPNSEIYIMTSIATLFEKILGQKFYHEKYDKIKTNKNIKSKILSSEEYKDDFIKLFKTINTKIRQIKFLPYRLSNPISTEIWPESISFQSFFGEIPFIIEIKNQEFRDSFLDNFNILWKIAN